MPATANRTPRTALSGRVHGEHLTVTVDLLWEALCDATH